MGVRVQGGPAGQRRPRQRDHPIEDRVVAPHPLRVTPSLAEPGRPIVVADTVDHARHPPRIPARSDPPDLVQHRDHMPEQRAHVVVVTRRALTQLLRPHRHDLLLELIKRPGEDRTRVVCWHRHDHRTYDEPPTVR
jgi:hypothetical protein